MLRLNAPCHVCCPCRSQLLYYICIVAQQDIPAFTELTYDYGWTQKRSEQESGGVRTACAMHAVRLLCSAVMYCTLLCIYASANTVDASRSQVWLSTLRFVSYKLQVLRIRSRAFARLILCSSVRKVEKNRSGS
jgi:hypothetical protein